MMLLSLVIALGLAAVAHAAQPTTLQWDASCSGADFCGTVVATKVGSNMAYHDDSAGTPPNPLASVTIRMQRCKTYSLTLKSNLGLANGEYTSIHTHGLHVSGNAPGDNVLHDAPGETDPFVKDTTSFTYKYSVPCDHGGGTFWYHSHTEQTAPQISAGLAGALIVEDGGDNPEQVPAWISEMKYA